MRCCDPTTEPSSARCRIPKAPRQACGFATHSYRSTPAFVRSPSTAARDHLEKTAGSGPACGATSPCDSAIGERSGSILRRNRSDGSRRLRHRHLCASRHPAGVASTFRGGSRTSELGRRDPTVAASRRGAVAESRGGRLTRRDAHTVSQTGQRGRARRPRVRGRHRLRGRLGQPARRRQSSPAANTPRLPAGGPERHRRRAGDSGRQPLEW